MAGILLVTLYSWPALVSGLAAAACWCALSCMAIVGYHVWFGRHLGLRDASCWSVSCRYIFFASAPPYILESICVVMSFDGLIVVFPWWVRHYLWGVLYLGCPSCYSIGIVTMLPPVHFLQPSLCISGDWSYIWQCSCSRNLTFTLTSKSNLLSAQ